MFESGSRLGVRGSSVRSSVFWKATRCASTFELSGVQIGLETTRVLRERNTTRRCDSGFDPALDARHKPSGNISFMYLLCISYNKKEEEKRGACWLLDVPLTRRQLIERKEQDLGNLLPHLRDRHKIWNDTHRRARTHAGHIIVSDDSTKGSSLRARLPRFPPRYFPHQDTFPSRYFSTTLHFPTKILFPPRYFFLGNSAYLRAGRRGSRAGRLRPKTRSDFFPFVLSVICNSVDF